MNFPQKKIMSKDEVNLLIDLIKINPVLTSKITNATTNKTKDETWSSLTSVFNAKSSSIPRTKEQLKLKWDNLKKAARKRTQEIKKNNLMTGGGKADIIPSDEILDPVISLLSCTGSVVPCDGDDVASDSLLLSINDMDDDISIPYDGSSIINNAKPNVVKVLIETPNKSSTRVKKRKILKTENFSSASSFGINITDHLKKSNKKCCSGNMDGNTDDGRRMLNLAIAKYFEKRTVKLELEIELLKFELNKKRNEN